MSDTLHLLPNHKQFQAIDYYDVVLVIPGLSGATWRIYEKK